MKNLKKVLVSLLCLLTVMVFTGCGDDAEAVIGNTYTTKDKGIAFDFREDNKAYYSFLGLPGTFVEYSVKGDEIFLNIEGKEHCLKYNKKEDTIVFDLADKSVTLMQIEK